MEFKAVPVTTNKNPIVAQSNQLTEARYSLTVAEQRLVVTLLSFISPDDEDFKDYEIKISDFKTMLDIKSNTVYEQVREILKKLQSRVIEIPHTDEVLGWFSYSRYIKSKGVVIIRFDKGLKPYLLKLKEQFTKYRLNTVTQFQSSYTIRIYMLLKQYETIGFREFSVDELKYILGVEAESYNEFKRFRARVINQAKKEFETKNKEAGGYMSDITFDLETIRTGRKITRLRFNIRKQNYQERLPFEFTDSQVKNGSARATVSLEKYGIGEVLAKQFVEEQGEEDILRCVALYEEKLKAGKVKDPGGGYLLSMLKAEAGKKTKAEQLAEEETAKKKAKEKEAREREKQKEKREQLITEFNKKAVAEYLQSLQPQEKSNLLKEVQKEYPAKDLEGGVARAYILQKGILPGYEKNKKSYLKKHG